MTKTLLGAVTFSPVTGLIAIHRYSPESVVLTSAICSPDGKITWRPEMRHINIIRHDFYVVGYKRITVYCFLVQNNVYCYELDRSRSTSNIIYKAMKCNQMEVFSSGRRLYSFVRLENITLFTLNHLSIHADMIAVFIIHTRLITVHFVCVPVHHRRPRLETGIW